MSKRHLSLLSVLFLFSLSCFAQQGKAVRKKKPVNLIPVDTVVIDGQNIAEPDRLRRSPVLKDTSISVYTNEPFLVIIQNECVGCSPEYQWKFEKSDQKNASLIKESYFSTDTETINGMPKVGGMREHRFLLKCAGMGTVIYFYQKDKRVGVRVNCTHGVRPKTVVSKEKFIKAVENTTDSVSLSMGDKLTVLFNKECVGCQYIWSIKSMDGVQLVREKDEFKNWTGEGQPAGFSGGNQDHLFHFVANERGRSVIRFVYFDNEYTLIVKTK